MDLCVAAWSMCCGDSCINIAKFGRCAYARRPFCVTLIGFDGTWFYTDGRAVIKIGHTKISVPLIYNVLTFYLSEGTIYPVLVQSVFFCPKRKSEVQIYAQKINRQTADCSFPCSADGAHLLYCSAFLLLLPPPRQLLPAVSMFLPILPATIPVNRRFALLFLMTATTLLPSTATSLL